MRRFTGRLSGISNSPKTSKQVLSSGLRAGLNVMMLRGGVEDDDESELGGSVDDDDDDDAVDMSKTLGFELQGGGGEGDLEEDVDGRDEELIVVDGLLIEAAEGLREGEEMGDKRNPRMGRDSTELDREGSCS